jgi:hypothetical protein
MDSAANPPREPPETSRPLVLRYGFALVSIALATWVRVLLAPVLGNANQFSTLLFAVLVTAWYGGARPALLAVNLGVVFADYFLIPPLHNFGFVTPAHYTDVALYVIVGVGIAALGGVMQAKPLALVRRLTQARDLLTKSEERLSLTLRSTGIGVWSWDITPNILEADDHSSVRQEHISFPFALTATLSFQHGSITRIVYADLNGLPALVSLHPRVCTAGSIGLHRAPIGSTPCLQLVADRQAEEIQYCLAVIMMCAAISIANACAITVNAGITVAQQTIELAGGRNAAGHR